MPEGLAAGLRRLADRGSGWFATSRRGGDRFGRRDDVLVVAQGRGGAGSGTAFGGKVAHLALDDARIVPAPAALSRDGEDLDQDPLNHALALPRGKRRRGREDDAGPPARYG